MAEPIDGLPQRGRGRSQEVEREGAAFPQGRAQRPCRLQRQGNVRAVAGYCENLAEMRFELGNRQVFDHGVLRGRYNRRQFRVAKGCCP